MVVWLNIYKLTGLTDVVTCQVKAQMEALNEQLQRPEVQEQMKEVQSLMQDKDFAAKIEKLRVRMLYHVDSVRMHQALTKACHAVREMPATLMHRCVHQQAVMQQH